MVPNKVIAKILREMAALYKMNDISFKPQAYEKAAWGVDDAEERLRQAVQAGVKLTINTDAHSRANLGLTHFGII